MSERVCYSQISALAVAAAGLGCTSPNPGDPRASGKRARKGLISFLNVSGTGMTFCYSKARSYPNSQKPVILESSCTVPLSLLAEAPWIESELQRLEGSLLP